MDKSLQGQKVKNNNTSISKSPKSSMSPKMTSRNLESSRLISKNIEDNPHLMLPLKYTCSQKKLCSLEGALLQRSENSSPHSLSKSPRSPLKNQLNQNDSKKRLKLQKKPRPFKLKDLKKYSQKLNSKNLKTSSKLKKSVLEGKDKSQKRGANANNDSSSNGADNSIDKSSPPGSPGKNIEWTKTPVHQQFFLKLTETETLEDKKVGHRKYRNQNKNQNRQQIEIDLQNKDFIKKLLEDTLKNIYSETEVEYLIKILKNKNPSQDQMELIFDKAIDTFEVLMCKIGLEEQCWGVVEQYEEELTDSYRYTLIKLLTRCKILYMSLGKLQVIFKIIKNRNEIEVKIQKCFRENSTHVQGSKNQEDIAELLEQDIAQYCYQSSRLFIQITSFMIESQLFKRLKFIYEGIDYQAKIRKQVDLVKAKYEKIFGDDKIPNLNELEKLVFKNIESPENELDNMQQHDS